MHYLLTLSLSDPPQGSVIGDGIFWMQGAVLGTTATVVAIIAVATVGLLMLTGRLGLRRGLTVVLGCFILFGASGIASTLTGQSGTAKEQRLLPPKTNALMQAQGASQPSSYDPYAGASVPSTR
jgi:type IV secretory pathway VirB2 component (pilin)